MDWFPSVEMGELEIKESILTQTTLTRLGDFDYQLQEDAPERCIAESSQIGRDPSQG
jgi:hypothetical protein